LAATALATLAPVTAHAELPLNIDDLIVAAGRHTFGLATNYSNAQNNDITSGAPVQVPLGGGQFVTLPSNVGQIQSNTDGLVLTPSWRYGVNGSTELNLRASLSLTQVRFAGASETTKQLQDIWAGATHPALLVLPR
jgi:hypothetical protein